MIGPGGGLAVPCVMDLFERQRTTLIGGQEGLETPNPNPNPNPNPKPKPKPKPKP